MKHQPNFSTARTTNAVIGLSLVAAIAAGFSATCCVLPIALTILGFGGGWLAFLGFFATNRPYVLATGLVLLALAAFLMWRQNRSCSKNGQKQRARNFARSRRCRHSDTPDGRGVGAALGAGSDALSLERLDQSMTSRSLLQIGVIGTIVTAICCFTPLLVILLGAIGLSSAIGLLDIVLLPALGLFIVITGYGLWKRSHKL